MLESAERVGGGSVAAWMAGPAAAVVAAAPPMPSAVVMNGAQKMKTGAMTNEKSKSKMPEPVPPRDKTTIARTKEAMSIGPAIIHEAKPMTGMSESPQVRKSRIQPVRAGAL